MRKTVRFVLCVIAVLSAAFCVTGCAKENRDGKPVVICSTFPVYDFARAVVGDEGVNLVLLIKPGQEVHSYEPTPRDLITIQDASLFLCVGGESDEWIDTLMKGKEFQKVPVVRLMDDVATLEEPEAFEDDENHEAEGGDQDEGVHVDEADEHIWTSPANARSMVMRIADAIGTAVPELDGTVLNANADRYCSEISQVEESIRGVVAAAGDPFIVMADRFPLVYMAEYYGIGYAAAFKGCSSAVEASSATISHLITLVQEKQLPCVYYIELSNHKIADVVASEAGVVPRMLHSVQNVTKDEFESGATWVSLMKQNAEMLRAGLK